MLNRDESPSALSTGGWAGMRITVDQMMTVIWLAKVLSVKGLPAAKCRARPGYALWYSVGQTPEGEGDMIADNTTASTADNGSYHDNRLLLDSRSDLEPSLRACPATSVDGALCGLYTCKHTKPLYSTACS